MTGFLVLMGLMVALGLAFVLPALTRSRDGENQMSRIRSNAQIYRDQLKELQSEADKGTLDSVQFESERQELGRRAIEDALSSLNDIPVGQTEKSRWVPVVIAVLLPVAAIGIYLKLGSPEAASLAPASGTVAIASGSAQPESPHGMSFEQIRESADKLAQRMQANPSDGEGWAMLARSWNVLGRYQEAASAYEKAASLLPPDAQLMADYADALAMSQGQKLDGKPLEIIKWALKTDPTNLKALALAGTAAFEHKDYKEAVGYWEKVVQTAPADSEFARSIQGSLEEAHARMEGRPPVAALPDIMPARSASASLAPGGASITGNVKLAPQLAGKVRPDDTVFIFARAEKGPRMPLAIASYKASELPLRFSLDDSSGMSPDMKLSDATSVKVVARISRSGNASAQSGDLEGAAGPVKPGSQGIQVSIDNVVP